MARPAARAVDSARVLQLVGIVLVGLESWIFDRCCSLCGLHRLLFVAHLHFMSPSGQRRDRYVADVGVAAGQRRDRYAADVG